MSQIDELLRTIRDIAGVADLEKREDEAIAKAAGYEAIKRQRLEQKEKYPLQCEAILVLCQNIGHKMVDLMTELHCAASMAAPSMRDLAWNEIDFLLNLIKEDFKDKRREILDRESEEKSDAKS